MKLCRRRRRISVTRRPQHCVWIVSCIVPCPSRGFQARALQPRSTSLESVQSAKLHMSQCGWNVSYLPPPFLPAACGLDKMYQELRERACGRALDHLAEKEVARMA